MQKPDLSITLQVDEKATSTDLTKAKDALELAELYRTAIDSADMYNAAADQVKLVKTLYKAIDSKRKELTAPLDTLKKQWMDFFRPALDSLEQAEKILKNAMLAYDRKKEDERKDAEKKAREAAEAERIRLRKIAEEKEKAERAAREEMARKEREAQNARNAKERAELLAQAEVMRAAAEAADLEAAAAEIAATMVPTPVVIAQPVKVAGVSTRSVWTAEVYDLPALIAAVAAGAAPPAALLPDMKVLNKMAVALHDALSIPGVRAIEEKSMAVGK